MDITYKKSDNSLLFENFKDPKLLNMKSCQNYIPLYNNYFKLNGSNYNSINLNNENQIISITKKITENKYEGYISDENNQKLLKNIFFKLSPLLDPYKYLAGKYDISNQNLFALPKLNDCVCQPKVSDPNNSAYTDSFFTYLTSQLLNRKNFFHGIDFYGSFLGIKNEYHVNIGEDIPILAASQFFHDNKHLYYFINSEHEDLLNEDSRSNKKALNLGEDIADLSILNLEDLNKLGDIETISDTKIDQNSSLIYKDDNPNKETKSTCSAISSRSSNTNNNFENTEESCTEELSSNYESSSSEIDNIMVSIKEFPIQIISLESCESTLDELIIKDNLSDEELGCIVLQILMMLITYQKLFELTHNDLHTNNIMYIKTEKKYLYYKLNGRHYKVKTFGKIFKIIDFGRAIYTYRGKRICSDSFHKDGDAATQYNCEPYYNDAKSLIEPNMSFDLCRLGCSIYDFIIDEYESPDAVMRPIHKIITDWCNDDNDRNILYKNTDEERYPDFKLYKMIARKVHNHIPINELKLPYFNRFIVSKKEIKKGSKIMDIDTVTLNSADNI